MTDTTPNYTPALPKWAMDSHGLTLVYPGVHAVTKAPMDIVVARITEEATGFGGGMGSPGPFMMHSSQQPPDLSKVKLPERRYRLILLVHIPQGTETQQRLERGGNQPSTDGRWYISVTHTGLTHAMAQMLALANAPVEEEELDKAAELDGWGNIGTAAKREKDENAIVRVLDQHVIAERRRLTKTLRQQVKEAWGQFKSRFR